MCVCDLMDLPPGKIVIDCKGVYRVKTQSNGSIECDETRSCSQGFFIGIQGFDYEETHLKQELR